MRSWLGLLVGVACLVKGSDTTSVAATATAATTVGAAMDATAASTAHTLSPGVGGTSAKATKATAGATAKYRRVKGKSLAAAKTAPKASSLLALASSIKLRGGAAVDKTAKGQKTARAKHAQAVKVSHTVVDENQMSTGHRNVNVFLEGDPELHKLSRADCSVITSPYVYELHKHWYFINCHSAPIQPAFRFRGVENLEKFYVKDHCVGPRGILPLDWTGHDETGGMVPVLNLDRSVLCELPAAATEAPL